MKDLIAGFAVLVLVIISANTAFAADENNTAPKEMSEETPDAKISKLESENAELKEKVTKLEEDVKKLTPPPPPPPPPPKHWLFKFNLDLAYFTGNVEKTLLSDALYLKYDSFEAWNLVLQTTHTLVMDDDDITDQYGYFLANFEYAFSPWLASYAFTKHGWHEAQKMTYYGNVGLGGIWTFLKDPIDPKEFANNPNYNHRFLAAFYYESKSYANSAGFPNQDNFRIQFGLDLTQWLADDMVIGLLATWSPNIDDFEDWVLDALFWMEWIHNEYTKFRVSVQYIETTVVPDGVKSVDMIFKVGMEIKLDW